MHHSTLQSDLFLLIHNMPCFSESATQLYLHVGIGVIDSDGAFIPRVEKQWK